MNIRGGGVVNRKMRGGQVYAIGYVQAWYIQCGEGNCTRCTPISASITWK